jgi:type II secretory pathway pseudopilin PulG
MIEMLGVLAIVGVLSVGGIAGYSKAMMKFKINKIVDQVTHIATNIRTLYAQQTTYAGLNTPNAVAMGVIPDSISTNILKNYSGSNDSYYYENANPFNGNVIVYNIWESDRAFVIAYTGIPKEACVTLATYDWGSNHSSGLKAITVSSSFDLSGPRDAFADDIYSSIGCDSNTRYTEIACPGDATNPTPMSVVQAARGCACEDSACSIGWKFQ